MDFGLSSEQVALQDTVNRYLDEFAGLDSVRAFAEGGDYRAVWGGLAELGVAGLLVPEAEGGVGLTALDAALVAECLGAHAAPGPFIGSAVVAPLALRLASADVRQRYLPGLIDGTVTAGVGISELAGARADAGVTAKDGRLNGKSLFVLDPTAEILFVATTDRAVYLVETGAVGLEQLVQTTVDRTRRSGELRFDHTPAIQISSDPACAGEILDAARVMLAADTLGAAQYMLDSAVAYAKERRQFGRVIASFQAVKHMCAEMAAELEPCRAMMWYAAHALSEIPDEACVTACHAKAHIAEVGTFVAKTATEVHGGIGFTDLLGLPYWFKRIGFNRQCLGSPELVREQAALVQGF